MFKDYYAILGIDIESTQEEIKEAYRSMSLKWHPDRNPGIDVKSTMQDINEAYVILKDPTKRFKYDSEYRRFYNNYQQKHHSDNEYDINEEEFNKWADNYDIYDDDVKENMQRARDYAKELVEEFLRSLKKTSKDAVDGAWDVAKWYILASALLFLAFVCFQTCN